MEENQKIENISENARTLTGKDIGMASFGVSVKECDEANEFITNQLKRNKEQGGVVR